MDKLPHTYAILPLSLGPSNAEQARMREKRKENEKSHAVMRERGSSHASPQSLSTRWQRARVKGQLENTNKRRGRSLIVIVLGLVFVGWTHRQTRVRKAMTLSPGDQAELSGYWNG